MNFPERFVALDVEVASRSPLTICAIGAARYEKQQETIAYRSLVSVRGTVRFTRIHGLTRADLSGAPSWPAVWRQLLLVLGDITTVVAFRSEFDRAAILATSANHGVRLPRLQFVCAALMMQQRHHSKVSLRASLEILGLPFPGQPHEPLADARAAAQIAIACTAASPTSV